jgi:hypothetical protein
VHTEASQADVRRSADAQLEYERLVAKALAHVAARMKGVKGYLSWVKSANDVCLQVHVCGGTIWLEEDTKPLYTWDVRRLQFNLALLKAYLARRTTTRDFTFFYCPRDGPDMAADPRLSASVVTCEGRLSLPIVQYASAPSRDGPWESWQAHVDRCTMHNNVPWADREAKAVWRGSLKTTSIWCKDRDCNRPNSSPCGHTTISADNWHLYARSRLLYLRAQHPDLYNVAVSSRDYPYWPALNVTFDPAVYPVDSPAAMPMDQQAREFKYGVYVEGNCGWAQRLKDQLLYGMLVFVQHSPCAEYYVQFFQPWVHYVPIDGRLDNLTDAILWARAHDAEAQAIAARAQAFARVFFAKKNIELYSYAFFAVVEELYDELSPQADCMRSPHAGQYYLAAELKCEPDSNLCDVRSLIIKD